MMHDVIPPILVFVVTAGLTGIGAEVMNIARTAKSTQEAVKALMRSDLVDRYRTYRDCGGWMSNYGVEAFEVVFAADAAIA